MRLLLFTLLLFITIHCIAQQSVSGIIHSGDNSPLPGVTIKESKTTNGTISGNNGEFTLKVPSLPAKIEVSYIGYTTREVKILSTDQLTIKLEKTNQNLNEVVITALGIKKSSKEVGYAIQKINGKDISSVQSPNLLDNLSAKIAGIEVTQGASGVGSSSKISIRGETSFNNNDPLFVIDGTPIQNNSVINFTSDAAAGFQEIDFGNGAMDIAADDIETINVLKGANAAALYGSRAANGVILITTKKASKRNQGIGTSFNSTFVVDRAFQLPKFQNKYGQGNSGQFAYQDGQGGGINDNITYSWGAPLDQGVQTTQFDGIVTLPDGTQIRGGDTQLRGESIITPSELKSYKNNLRNFYQTGVTATNNIVISNSGEKSSQRFSFTDMRSKSIIPGVDYKRKNVASNFQFSPTEKTKISTNIHYINSTSGNRPSSGYGSENLNYSLVAWGPRSLNIENLKDYWQPGLEDIQQYSFNYTYFDNPYFILHENKNSLNKNRVIGNMLLEQEITKELSTTFRTGIDYTNELRTFKRAFSTNRFKRGAYAEQRINYFEQNSDVLVTYKKKVSNVNTELSVGASRFDQNASSIQSQAKELAQPGIYNLRNAAVPIEIFQLQTKKRINSLYGIVKVGYKNFLFAQITGRNDWSSALATPTSSDNSAFFYPSGSLSYILSNTVDLPEAISFLKLRTSVAQVGNDTDPYLTSSSFVAQTPYINNPTFTANNLIANSQLLPEKTTSFEYGTDIRLFKNRIRFDLTYFQSYVENQIITLPVPISSGYNNQIVNGAKVISKGVEIFSQADILTNKQVKWTTGINFSHNTAIVDFISENVDKITLGYSSIYDNDNQTVWFQVEKGGQIGDFYGTGYKKNENGDFIIDENGKYIVDSELKKLGNYNPDFVLGLSNQFTYKNWNLNFLFDWHQGGEIVSRTLSLAAVGGQLIETENRPEEGIIAQGVVNIGTEESPVWEENTTAIPAETYYRQYYDRNHEENNVYDASYLKLRQFSLGYSFEGNNEKGLLRSGKSLNIALIGRNIFAISHIPHFDPEQMAIQGNKFLRGVEDMSYATTRSFGIKINYNF